MAGRTTRLFKEVVVAEGETPLVVGPPAFELGLWLDSRRTPPEGAEWVLRGGEHEWVRPLTEGVEDAGFRTWKFEGIAEATRYSLDYRLNGETTGVFSDVELAAYLDPPQEGAAVWLAGRLRKEGADDLPLKAARLTGADDGAEHPLEQGAGGLSGRALALEALSGARCTLELEPQPAQGALTTVALSISAGDPPRVGLAGDAPADVSLVRLRGSKGGEPGRTIYLVTATALTPRVLVIPLTTATMEGDDRAAMRAIGKKVASFYEAKGYQATRVWGTEFFLLTEHLRQAAQDGVRYRRVVFVGHGGWDGPIPTDGPQVSSYADPQQFQDFARALRDASTPDMRLYSSACHTAGSDRFEIKQPQADYARLKAQLGNKKPEEMPEEWRWQWESANLLLSRWAVDLARLSGRAAGGPAGSTSVGFTMNHVRIMLEREEAAGLAMHQECYFADSVAGTITKFMPRTPSFAAATTTPWADAPPPPAEEAEPEPSFQAPAGLRLPLGAAAP